MTLLNTARGYLEADGWDVRARGRELLRGERDSALGDDEREHIHLWVLNDPPDGFASREGPFLDRFAEARAEHPDTSAVFLVPTTAGLSTDFRTSARRRHGVKTLVPAQLFDSDFKWERHPDAAGASRRLHDRGADGMSARVPQPWHPDGEAGVGDLLDTLTERLRAGGETGAAPNIHIVAGPAGMGKSVLFEALYARLYAAFQDDKSAQRRSPRPFALLPEYVYEAASTTVESLLDTYLNTEFARPMSRDMFNWRLVTGGGIWMLDGLDEILERDARFFQYLEDLMTLPSGDTAPPVLIAVRDSLLATHRGLIDFREEYGEHIAVYTLSPWQWASKRALAARKAGVDPEAFMRGLTAVPALDALASNPYHCGELLDEFGGGGFVGEATEHAIMERAVSRVIARERAKEAGLLADVSDDGVRAFLESCAVEGLQGGGVSVDGVRLYAETVVDADGTDDVSVERALTQLGQLPVFAAGGGGELRFAQEPLQHHLAAASFKHSLLHGAYDALGAHDIPAAVIARLRGALDGAGEETAAWEWAEEHAHADSAAGRNALALAMRLAEGGDQLRRIGLAGLDLAGAVLADHALDGADLTDADLTNADLSGTDITGAILVNCILKETRLPDDPEMLASVQFGAGRRFHSAWAGEAHFKRFADLAAFAVPDADGERERDPACATALQLRHIFGKFVDETGHRKRAEIAERALRRGKLFVSDQGRAAILDEAIRRRYLVVVPQRDRVKRAGGDALDELVRFTVDLELSDGIRSVLDATCGEPGCPHVR